MPRNRLIGGGLALGFRVKLSLNSNRHGVSGNTAKQRR